MKLSYKETIENIIFLSRLFQARIEKYVTNLKFSIVLFGMMMVWDNTLD